jgi:protein transport protein SEC61 subunit gamma-like protein
MEFQPYHQEYKPSLWQKLKKFGRECRRVLKVTKKPSQMEFKTIVKVSGIGMLLIGFIGFVVHMVKQLLI